MSPFKKENRQRVGVPNCVAPQNQYYNSRYMRRLKCYFYYLRI